MFTFQNDALIVVPPAVVYRWLIWNVCRFQPSASHLLSWHCSSIFQLIPPSWPCVHGIFGDIALGSASVNLGCMHNVLYKLTFTYLLTYHIVPTLA